ncbi:MAG TPA: radical SAM protein, partial [Bacillota bacterium]|nr:radical SAM protein [Bacillota bacterium]
AVVGACEKFMPHIHVSLQSGSPSVLSRMNRPYDAYQASQYIERALRAIPRLKLSADIIAGFPGETNSELEETVSFLKQYPFVHVHTFPYSQRKNTKAADMDGQLSGTEKRERCLYIIQESEKIRRRILEKKIGERAMVLTEKCRDGVSSGMSEDYIETHFNASSKPGTVTDVTVIDVTDTAAGGSALTAKVP